MLAWLSCVYTEAETGAGPVNHASANAVLVISSASALWIGVCMLVNFQIIMYVICIVFAS
jgi:hypothetical protein